MNYLFTFQSTEKYCSADGTLSSTGLGVHIIWYLKGLWDCKTWPLITLRAGLLTVLWSCHPHSQHQDHKDLSMLLSLFAWPYLDTTIFSCKFTSLGNRFLNSHTQLYYFVIGSHHILDFSFRTFPLLVIVVCNNLFQGQICLLPQVFLDFLLLHSSPL